MPRSWNTSASSSWKSCCTDRSGSAIPERIKRTNECEDGHEPRVSDVYRRTRTSDAARLVVTGIDRGAGSRAGGVQAGREHVDAVPHTLGRPRPAGRLEVRSDDAAGAAEEPGGQGSSDRRRGRAERGGRTGSGSEAAGRRGRNRGWTAIGGRVADPRQRVQQLLAGPRKTEKGLQPHVVNRRAAGRTPALHARCAESGGTQWRTVWRGPVRVVSGSGHRRAVPHRRRDRVDVAGSERGTQSNRAEPRLRDDSP